MTSATTPDESRIWEFSLMTVGGIGAVEPGQILTARIPRGIGLDEVLTATTDGVSAHIDGAALRCLLLQLHNPFPMEMAHIGANRFAVSLSSSHGSLAWADGQEFGRTTYRLFSREPGESPQLTRWQRVGLARLDELLTTAGWQGESNRNRAFWHVVSEGLPREVPVRARSASSAVVEAPPRGWLDVGDGLLSDPPPIVPLYRVQVVAPWDQAVEYPTKRFSPR